MGQTLVCPQTPQNPQQTTRMPIGRALSHPFSLCLFLGDGYLDFQDCLPNSQGLSEPSESEASLPRIKETKQDALGIPGTSLGKFYPSSKDRHQEAPFPQLGGTDVNFVWTLICIF